MANPIPRIAQALAIACLNQPSFVDTLVKVSTIEKPAAAKDAKLLGETVGEFYRAVCKEVEKLYRKS